MNQIIPVTDFIRNFGKYAQLLPGLDELILTREGRPFANVRASREEKRKLMQNAAGLWKGTSLDNDAMWKDVLTRKSKVKHVNL